MANVGSYAFNEYLETFAIDTISTGAADGIAWANSSDSSDTAFARAVAAGRGLHCAGALTTTENNMIEFCSDQVFIYGQDGYAMWEALVMIDDVSLVAINFGLNDDSLDASNTLPAELSGTTWTSNAATFLGLAYDTDATNDEFHCFWVDDDSDTSTAIADLRMKGAAPVANKWMLLRVEIQDRGSGNGVRATFTWAQDGKSVSKTFDTSVDRDVALCCYLGIEQRATPGAKNVYVRLPHWKQSISD